MSTAPLRSLAPPAAPPPGRSLEQLRLPAVRREPCGRRFSTSSGSLISSPAPGRYARRGSQPERQRCRTVLGAVLVGWSSSAHLRTRVGTDPANREQANVSVSKRQTGRRCHGRKMCPSRGSPNPLRSSAGKRFLTPRPLPDFAPGFPFPQPRDEPIRFRAEVIEPGEDFDQTGFELPPPAQVALACAGQGERFGDHYPQPDSADSEFGAERPHSSLGYLSPQRFVTEKCSPILGYGTVRQAGPSLRLALLTTTAVITSTNPVD